MSDRLETKNLPPQRPRGGRPRRAEPCSSVCTWLSASEHDRLIKRAMRADKSLSAYVREILILTLR